MIKQDRSGGFRPICRSPSNSSRNKVKTNSIRVKSLTPNKLQSSNIWANKRHMLNPTNPYSPINPMWFGLLGYMIGNNGNDTVNAVSTAAETVTNSPPYFLLWIVGIILIVGIVAAIFNHKNKNY